MYDLEGFVNNSTVNFEGSREGFERAIVIWDAVNEVGFPVVVYEYQGIPVAWYDIENEWGHIL